MPTRNASVAWEGGLEDGKGRASLDSSGVATFDVAFPSRAADAPQSMTDPEELIGAAHATCFSMNLAGTLGKHDVTLKTLKTSAAVTLGPADGGGFEIKSIALTARATVDGADAERFKEIAAEAERTCPVSKALAGTSITLDADLES